MSSVLVLQTLETAAVVTGVIFGLIQLRQLRIQREIQAGIELLHPLQAPESGEAIMLMYSLPDNLSGDELRKKLGKEFGAVITIAALFESLGPLVARGHMPFEMYSDFYRGVTLLCWRKLRRYIEEQRSCGWPNLYEWLQWLAERMEERGALSDVPAFERYREWTCSNDFERLHGKPQQVSK